MTNNFLELIMKRKITGDHDLDKFYLEGDPNYYSITLMSIVAAMAIVYLFIG